MAGRNYLAGQAVTLLKFAKATTNPEVAARLLEKAALLTAKMEEAPDVSPRPPDVEQPDA